MAKNKSYKALGLIFLLSVMILFNSVFFSAWTFNNNVVSWYEFDQSTGANVINNATGGFNGTVMNANNARWVAGRFGNGYNLNGTSSVRINITDISMRINDDMTYCFWWKNPASITTDSGVFFQWSTNHLYDLELNGSFRFVDAGAAVYLYTTGLSSAGFTHMCLSRDVGGSTTLYVNGTAYASTTGSSPAMYTPEFFIGGDGTMSGTLDELLIVNKSLNSTEVTEVYNFAPTAGSTLTTATINLSFPQNATIINSDGTYFSTLLNMSGGNYSHQWKNDTFYVWFINGTLLNKTVVSSLTGNNTNVTLFIDSFSLAEYKWNAYACYGNATLSNCSWGTNNLTFTYVPFSNTGESYSLSSYETMNETFYLNITTITGAAKMGAFLVYNGTYYAASHTCVGSNCQVSRTLDIPLMTTPSLSSENKSFYWQITIFGTFGTSTSLTTAHNQNVSNIVFKNCVAGYNNSVNFTIYNETDLSLIDTGFKSTFYYWLGTGTVKDIYNFSGEGRNHYLFCINKNLSYITSSYITINSTINSRIYQFVKEIYTNSLKIQKLFLPDNSYSRDIIIEVKNQGLVPQKDIVVNVSRYYPATNTYEKVENQVTDEYGQVIAKLIENDAKYKFNFFDSNGTLLKTSDLVTVICRSSICVIPFIIETTEDYLENYNNISLFDYQLDFDNTTNIFTYSWDDQTGQSATHRLIVTRYAFNESTIVCNVSSTTTVSSLTCNVGNNPASYTAQTFRKTNGNNQIRVTYLQVIVGDYSTTFGIEGLFWVFILLMICVGIGVYNPSAGAGIYGAGFIIMGLLKIIYMPLPVFFANTLLVGLFIWAVKT